MNRFRKKSDAKRPELPDSLNDSEALFELPPITNFRTSLILPDLTRRFSLLRTASGNPVSVNDLRSHFARQRARGAENQISEEEEDMILGELDRIRSDNATAGESPFGESPRRTSNVPYTERQSLRSTDTSMSSPTTGLSPFAVSPRYVKRHSNNLFGSGRFRDEVYLRSVMTQKAGSQRSAASAAHTESSGVSNKGNDSTSYTNSSRPTTPETVISLPSSLQSSPEKADTTTDSEFMPIQPSYPETTVPVTDHRIYSPSALRRASLAVVEVFKEIEEEVEDEIVMPRSTPPSRAVASEQVVPVNEMNDSTHGNAIQTGMAISFDKETVLENGGRFSPPAYNRSGTTSPTPRLPGYIPGMPRPMTPRVADSEEQLRSLSTTPRAASPPLPTHTSSNALSGLMRRGSDAQTSRFSQRSSSPSSSPFYLPRVPNGSILSEIERSGDSFSIDFDSSIDSSILGCRRPASPHSGSDYRPTANSPRPGTPSNITWNVPVGLDSTNHNTQADAMGTNPTHRRQASWIGDNAAVADTPPLSVPSKSNIRSPSSQVSVDSSLVQRTSSPIWSSSIDPDKRSSATTDFAVPLFTSRIPRSPTPTQNAPQSPTASTFSICDLSPANSPRSSKQTAPSTPFSIGSFHPFVFSPLINSSRSSLESTGSSYHSWEGERKGPYFFTDSGTLHSVWHNISTTTEKFSSVIPGETPDEGSDTEGIIGRCAGLAKSDFFAIQEKLVGVANSAPDVRERVPSLRRRRPSTSQSTYSVSGREAKVGSPLPRSLSPIIASQNEKSLKGTALLDSVLDSIRSPRTPILDIPIDDKLTATIRSDPEPSPTTRRNRDLAQALFGVQDRSNQNPPNQSSIAETVTKTVDDAMNVRGSPSPESTDSSAETTEITPTSQYEPQLNSQPATTDVASAEQDDLVVEVQRKTEAAMVALHRDPSQSNIQRGGVSGSISRRRVNPGQISTPRLVSATTSVDTIPLRSPSVASGNTQGFSQRFKRLTGTLRSKPSANYTEYSIADSFHSQSPLSSQVATYDPASLTVPGPPLLSSATETGTFKDPLPSPPASAGPGLKGFMARFRKRGTVDATQDPGFRDLYQNSPFTPSARASTPLQRNTTITRNTHEPVQRDDSPSRYLPPPSVQEPPTAVFGTTPVTSGPAVPSNGADDSALKQLFAAANDLGLDQGALNELLARSGSIRQKPNANEPMATNGAIANTEMLPSASALLPSPAPRSSTDSRPDDTLVQKTSIRKAPDQTRRPRPVLDENTAAVNAIVRRTIIYPSESRSSTFDVNILMRKHSQSIRHRRSTSSNSTSTRSVHDRVPTPPPPRSSTSKRFSTDNSPPVPQLPFSYASFGENQVFSKSAPAGPIEKSSSAYDSLYEMYAGDNKASAMASSESHVLNPVQSSQNGDSDRSDPLPAAESGPALEVLEMANGETIWSIVNGLRDDDAESLWNNRTSFASENSLRESNGVNGVQVLAKEQGKKNSNPSFLSRKKSQGRSHPETKVFYSSSAQIGHLIENLSQGKDAGSFNFMPHSNRGHSHSSLQSESDIQWTVEERLEYMLGSMGRA